MTIRSLIRSPIRSGIRSLIGGIPTNKPLRWVVSSNSFVIADTNGRIIKAGK